jgi:hypothetical protein
MNIDQQMLREAGATTGLTDQQTTALWDALESSRSPAPPSRFGAAHVAYYFGALIVIGAMGWFMTTAWESFGGRALFAVAAVYALCFVLGGRTLWRDPATRIPGGLLITMAVCMAPLATYGIERWSGWWPSADPGTYSNFHPYINSSWVIMEVVTILAGAIALRFWRFPFLTAPIAYALWYLSMDGVALMGGSRTLSWEEKKFISVLFGGAVLLVSYFADLKSKAADFAFWGYLFGLGTFWGALSSMNSDSEFGKLAYGLINCALIVCSVVLKRRVFIVFGSLGVLGYIGHLAHRVFADSLIFPVVLTLLGLGIIYLGIQYQKRSTDIERRFRAVLLPRIRGLVPPRALE